MNVLSTSTALFCGWLYLMRYSRWYPRSLELDLSLDRELSYFLYWFDRDETVLLEQTAWKCPTSPHLLHVLSIAGQRLECGYSLPHLLHYGFSIGFIWATILVCWTLLLSILICSSINSNCLQIVTTADNVLSLFLNMVRFSSIRPYKQLDSIVCTISAFWSAKWHPTQSAYNLLIKHLTVSSERHFKALNLSSAMCVLAGLSNLSVKISMISCNVCSSAPLAGLNGS